MCDMWRLTSGVNPVSSILHYPEELDAAARVRGRDAPRCSCVRPTDDFVTVLVLDGISSRYSTNGAVSGSLYTIRANIPPPIDDSRSYDAVRCDDARSSQYNECLCQRAEHCPFELIHRKMPLQKKQGRQEREQSRMSELGFCRSEGQTNEGGREGA